MKEYMFSVIVPVYNVEKFLVKCLDSVVNQTYRNLEIILIDDGSPDNSPAICDEYAARDGRVRVIHQKNAGQAAARNVGISIAKGDYITFVDSDDWIEPDTLEKAVGIIQRNEAVDIVLYNHVEEHGKKKITMCMDVDKYSSTERIKEGVLRDDIGSYARNIYRRNLWDGIKFPENCFYEDMAIIIDVFMRAKSIEILNECLYHYNFTNLSSTTRRWSAKSKYGMFLGSVKRIAYAKECGNKDVLVDFLEFGYKTCVTGLSMDSISHLLRQDQRERMQEYLLSEDCAAGAEYVKVKYKLLRWGLLHCIFVPKLYGYGMIGVLALRGCIDRLKALRE